MGAAASALLTGLPVIGDVVAGKYKIERVLAIGGMGAVMAAHDAALDRRIAIKFMLPKALESPEVRERFFREARAAVSIRSEHVVDVFEVGVASPDMPYIVMEYLPGRDLHQLLENRSPLPVAEAVDFVLQACEALAEAHSLGIIHRDVKPSNLFVTHRPDGSAFVKVLDFGISKTIAKMEEQAKSLTQSSVSLGSPLYMSPEQVRNSKIVDSRTDIWSLGIVLYELLTKQLPFDGETIPSLAAAIASDPPRRLRETRPDVPVKLEAVIMKCLEKDPAKRYQKIGGFARDIVEFAEPGRRALAFENIEDPGRVSAIAFESTSERRSPLSESETAVERSGSASVGAATTAGLGTTARHVERKRRSLGMFAAGVLVLGVSGAAFLQFKTTPPPSPDTSPAARSVTERIAEASGDRRIVDIEQSPPIAPLGSAPTSAPVKSVTAPNVVTPTPKTNGTRGLVSPSPKRLVLVAKPAPAPAVSVKPPPPPPPPKVTPEPGGLPSALGGSR